MIFKSLTLAMGVVLPASFATVFAVVTVIDSSTPVAYSNMQEILTLAC